MQEQIELNISLFDHGIFPVSQKWGLLNLYNFYQKLLEKCDRLRRIDQQVLKQLVIQMIPCFSSQETEAYIQVFKLLVMGGSSQNNTPQAIDTRKFTVFMFIQMYTSSQQRQSLEQSTQSLKRSQFQESIKAPSKDPLQQYSPLNSPRSKTMRVSMSENQQISFFIKYNLKTILKLLSSEESIDLQQLEGLSILFKQPAKFLSLFSANKKYEINEIAALISDRIFFPEHNRHVISGLTRSVQVKEEEFCRANADLKIQNCEDSQIMLMGVCNTVQLQNCSNCTVFVLGVKQLCTVDKCESVSLTLSCSMMRVGNTIDSQFYYYGPMGPILYGDNRNIQLGPHNANYIDLPYAVKEMDMQLTSQLAIKFQEPVSLNNNKCNYKIVKPKEISMCVLPSEYTVIEASRCKDFENLRDLVNIPKTAYRNSAKHMGVIIPVLSPGEYKQEVYLRYKNLQEFQKKIAEQGLSGEQMVQLHMAVQGHFREWLVNSGSYKQVNDLLKMIDQDTNVREWAP